MKQGQVIKDVALFPMEVLSISQGMYGQFSHKESMAIDIVGLGVGIESAYAPFDLSVVWKDSLKGNGLCFQSDREVLWANGELDYVTFVMWHKNDIKAFSVGQKFKQGEKIYEEGTAGFATGNHIHLNVAKGKYQGGYPLIKNNSGVWVIKNQVPPMDVFFVNDTIIRNDFNYKWQVYKPSSEIHRQGLPTLTVLANSLNYRKSPNGERLGTIPIDTVLPYLGHSGVVNGFNWAEVLYDNQIVYCAIEPTWNQITVPEKEVEVVKEVVKQLDETIQKEGYKIRVVVT